MEPVIHNYIVAKYAPAGTKRIAFVDTASLKIYRKLCGEGFANNIVVDDIKTIRMKENSAMPLYSFVAVYVAAECYDEITKIVDGFEAYLKNEYGPSSEGYEPQITLESYQELCDLHLEP